MTLYQKVNLNADVVARRKKHQEMMKRHYKKEKEKEWLNAMEETEDLTPLACALFIVLFIVGCCVWLTDKSTLQNY